MLPKCHDIKISQAMKQFFSAALQCKSLVGITQCTFQVFAMPSGE